MNSTWYRVKEAYPFSPFMVGDRIEITDDKRVKVNGRMLNHEEIKRVPKLDIFPNIFKKLMNGTQSKERGAVVHV